MVAWQATRKFLAECAYEPTLHLLRCDLSKDADGRRGTPDLKQLKSLLGPPNTGDGRGQTQYNWLLEEGPFEAAVRYADTLSDPIYRAGAPLLLCYAECDFLLKNPKSGSPLPFQGADQYLRFEGDFDRFLGQCYLRMWLHNRCYVYVYLSLPFDSPNDSFLSYVAFLQERLPFKFSAKHWKRWQLNKRGDGYVGRKIQFALSAGA